MSIEKANSQEAEDAVHLLVILLVLIGMLAAMTWESRVYDLEDGYRGGSEVSGLPIGVSAEFHGSGVWTNRVMRQKHWVGFGMLATARKTSLRMRV